MATAQNITSRRRFLAGTAGLATAAVVALPAGAAHDDAQLLDLGRQLAVAVAEYQAILPEALEENLAMSRAMRPVMDAIKARGESLDDHVEELCAASRPHMLVQDREAAILFQIDELCEAICKLAPQSLAGLRVHAEVLAFTFLDAWDEPLADLDWEPKQVRRLVETVRAFAGAVA